MEVLWVSKRIELWKLLRDSVQRSDAGLARQMNMSRSWVQKWRPRLQDVDGDDMSYFLSQSRRRKTSPRQVSEALEAKILYWREHLTETYGRRVGARNILFKLQDDMDLKRIESFVPKSPSTVHEVLLRLGCIIKPKKEVSNLEKRD